MVRLGPIKWVIAVNWYREVDILKNGYIDNPYGEF